jgi:transcription antitermination factor NusG
MKKGDKIKIFGGCRSGQIAMIDGDYSRHPGQDWYFVPVIFIDGIKGEVYFYDSGDIMTYKKGDRIKIIKALYEKNLEGRTAIIDGDYQKYPSQFFYFYPVIFEDTKKHGIVTNFNQIEKIEEPLNKSHKNLSLELKKGDRVRITQGPDYGGIVTINGELQEYPVQNYYPVIFDNGVKDNIVSLWLQKINENNKIISHEDKSEKTETLDKEYRFLDI